MKENPLKKLNMSDNEVNRLTNIAEKVGLAFGINTSDILKSMSSCTNSFESGKNKD